MFTITSEQIENGRQQYLYSQQVELLDLLVESNQDFTKQTNPPEGTFSGDVRITLLKKDITFIFDLQGHLNFIGNSRPKPKNN